VWTIENGIPKLVYDGVNDYTRGTSRGQLESIVAEELDAYICVPPVGSGNRMLGQISVTTTNRLSAAWNTGVANAYEARVGGGVNATISGALSGVRVMMFRRSGSGASTVSAIRIGLGAEVSTTTAGDSSAAATRLTFGASRLDTPTQFGDMQMIRFLSIRGLTTVTQLSTAQSYLVAYGRRFAGATV